MAFLKKNAQPILISFLAGVIGVITVVSLSPYFVELMTKKKEIVGIAGSYRINQVPEEILSKISNSLVFVNEKGEIIPLLAESWEQLDNGKEYRFYLKNDLTWGDGTEFTSADISYSFKDVTIEKPDDSVIVFKLTKPLPIFPTYLTQYVVKYPLQGVAGLYSVERVKSKFGYIQEIHLTPNRPGYPIYIYKFYDTETKLINAYKLGEITQMKTTSKNIADLFVNWNNTTIEKTVDYTQLLTLFFNMNNPLLQEKDVRKAIAQSISREMMEDLGEPAYGPVPPTSWAYNTQLRQLQYNPDVAKKVLEKYQSGTESAKLTISTFYDYLRTADQIKESLDSIGLNTDVKIFSSRNGSDFDMLLAFWKVPQDPDQYFYWHSTQKTGNISNYKNVRIDKLLEDGRNTLDQNQRKEIYDTFQKLIADDLPAYFLYYPYVYTISRK
ncbi:MAG: ABC transporter substrate-binding protein [Patescibacteria group bacterium]|nr:ABC transporter substrate-binding protein [Patescibacteria group bacterium]